MSFDVGDLATLGALLRDAAAAEIMPRFRKLAPGDIHAKSGPLDLVTAADEAAERSIADGLRRAFPGCTILGEEAASADPSLLAGYADGDLVFVVDPIDGTANYAAGLPLFGCMAAMVSRGEVIAAAILDPVGGDVAFALRGQGAWTETADGSVARMRVAPPVPLAEMSGSVSWRYMPPEMRLKVCAHLPRLAASFDLRCAAHAYRLLAAGHCHFMVFNRLLPWDHLPGWLLHSEAGGWSAQFDGRPYRPASLTGGLICTSDEASGLALRAALLGD